MKLSEQQWRERLSEEEFKVTRQKGTERPFSGELLHNKESGDYTCTCCGNRVFTSEAKFDSGCGWPSFSAQSDEENVSYIDDSSFGMRRVEIICKHCDAHLGHVFEDGPAPSGQRYCVNSLSIKFQPKK